MVACTCNTFATDVGIGTTAPVAQLDVHVTTNGTAALGLDFPHARNAIRFKRGGAVLGLVYKDQDEPLTFLSVAAGSTRAGFKFNGGNLAVSGGSVLLGTETASGAKLDVVTSAGAPVGINVDFAGADAALYLRRAGTLLGQIYKGTGQRLTFASYGTPYGPAGFRLGDGDVVVPSGSVGVGTESPMARLDVAIDSPAEYAVGVTRGGAVLARISKPAARPLLIESLAAGNTQGGFELRGGTVTAHDADVVGRDETVGRVALRAQAADWSSSFREVHLQVQDARHGSPIAGLPAGNLGMLGFLNAVAGLVYTNGAVPLVFGTAGNERLRIGGDGTVRVGTAQAPGNLEVTGNATISGQLTVAGATNQTISGDLAVAGALSAGSATVNGPLAVHGQANVNGQLAVNGGISATQPIAANGGLTAPSATIGGAFSASSVTANLVTVNGSLTALAAQIGGALSASSVTTNQVTVMGTLSAQAAQVGGAFSASSVTTNAATVYGGVIAASVNAETGDVKANRLIAQSASVNGPLDARGAIIIGDLTVNAPGRLYANGGVTASAVDAASGPVTANTVIANSATVHGGLTANSATVQGAVDAGGAIVRGALTVNAPGRIYANGGVTAAAVNAAAGPVTADSLTANRATVNNDLHINGRVGVGMVPPTIPSEKLDVVGTIKASQNVIVGVNLFVGGTVGIGTTTPAEGNRLDVAGKINVRGLSSDGEVLVSGSGLAGRVTAREFYAIRSGGGSRLIADQNGSYYS